MSELWSLLYSAQTSESGIPQELVNLKVRNLFFAMKPTVFYFKGQGNFSLKGTELSSEKDWIVVWKGLDCILERTELSLKGTAL